MYRAKGLIIFILSFIFGLFCADLFFDDAYLRLFFVFFLGLVFVYRRYFFLILLAFLFGFLRFYLAVTFPDNHVLFFFGDLVMEACIVDEPDVRADMIKYTFELKGFVGKVLVNAARYPVYEYGDCFELSGRLDDPGVFDDFDYARYLARYGIYKLIDRPKVSFLYHENLNWFMSYLFWMKSGFERSLNSSYAEPHASLLAGLILGSRRGIDEDLLQQFNASGLTHIIAISGYNITLLIVIINMLFAFFSRRLRVVLSLIFIVVFCLFVGASAAVLRASIMGGISLMALYFGRIYFVELAFILAAFLMALWNPRIILDDIGFQLSFLATGGLIYFGEKIMAFLSFLPKKFLLRESAAMTLAAQVLALPIILYDFGRLSLISPIANIFVLPFIPYAMLFGFLGLFFPGADFVAYLILELILSFISFFSSLPFASISFSWVSWVFVCMYYFIFLLVLRRKMFDFK